jgi:hypothetical protein
VELAGPDPGQAGRELRDEAEGDLLDLRDARLPVVRVGVEVMISPWVQPPNLKGRPDRLLEEFLLVRGGRLVAACPASSRCDGSEPNGRFVVTMAVKSPSFRTSVDVLIGEGLDQLRCCPRGASASR